MIQQGKKYKRKETSKGKINKELMNRRSYTEPIQVTINGEIIDIEEDRIQVEQWYAETDETTNSIFMWVLIPENIKINFGKGNMIKLKGILVDELVSLSHGEIRIKAIQIISQRDKEDCKV